ncbi:hypothetical protein CPC08DRAFT_763681 [Agrocybe pediades]|nr:hypothetical protein CPC08DRAFT_763681 [Agrocybe pediades]
MLLAVSALPAPVAPRENTVETRSDMNNMDARYNLPIREESLFVREDSEDLIFGRYFDEEIDLTDRGWAEELGTVEPRQAAQAAKYVAEGVGRMMAPFFKLKGIAKVGQSQPAKVSDNDFRSQFTSKFVVDLRKAYPQYNWVVCHTAHNYNFKGTQGKDWGHSHQELPISLGHTIGYEIYWFTEGVFRRTGDGGYLNWAYSGNVKSATNKNSVITFAKP